MIDRIRSRRWRWLALLGALCVPAMLGVAFGTGGGLVRVGSHGIPNTIRKDLTVVGNSAAGPAFTVTGGAGAAAGDAQFRVNRNDGTERIRITQDGRIQLANVGSLTINPGELHYNGSALRTGRVTAVNIDLAISGNSRMQGGGGGSVDLGNLAADPLIVSGPDTSGLAVVRQRAGLFGTFLAARTSGDANLLTLGAANTAGVATEQTLSTWAGQTYILSEAASVASYRLNQYAAPALNGTAGGVAEIVTDAATLYVAGAPTNDANVTVTRAHALWVDAGAVRLDGDLVVGGSTSPTETLANAGFVMGGDDAFVAGLLGVEGNVYTDGAFIAGATTTYADGSVTFTGAAPDIVLPAAGGTLRVTDGTNALLSVADAGTTGNVTVSGNLTVSGTQVTGSLSAADNAATFAMNIPVITPDAGTHTVSIQVDGNTGVSVAATGDGGGGVGARTVQIGVSAAADICTIGDANADVSITDAQWSVSAAGAPNFADGTLPLADLTVGLAAQLLQTNGTATAWAATTMGGDATIGSTGTLAIAANAVALATDTTGDYAASITAGAGLASTGATTGENIAHTLSTASDEANFLSTTAITCTVAGDTGRVSLGSTISFCDSTGLSSRTVSALDLAQTYSGAKTFSSAIAANAGITFDNATDTLGAHTLAGTLDANLNIITNIGNSGTDFDGTGALTLAGVLTANGAIATNANLDAALDPSERWIITSNLTAARSVDALQLSEPNNATFNSTANVLEVLRSDTGSTTAAAFRVASVSAGLGVDIDGIGSGTYLRIGASGTGLSTGTGLNLNLPFISTGVGLLADANGSIGQVGVSTISGDAMRVNFALDALTGDDPTFSGNLLDLTRNHRSTGTDSDVVYTGEALRISSQCTVTSTGTCTDSSNLASITQSFASGSGALLSLVHSGTGPDILHNTTPIIRIGNTGNMVWDDGTNTLMTLTDAGANGTLNVSGTLQQGGTGVVLTSRTLTGGAGIAAIGDLSVDRTIATASTESDFLANAAVGACGATTQGQIAITDGARVLWYCDDQAVPAVTYAALANSSGVATSATALAANGSNCGAGQWAAGVDTAGAAEGCTADDDIPDAADYTNLTGGDGVVNSPTGTIALDTSETNAISNGALTCSLIAGGRKLSVTGAVLGYCDNDAIPTQRYAAYGDSSGNATVLACTSACVSSAEIVDNDVTASDLSNTVCTHVESVTFNPTEVGATDDYVSLRAIDTATGDASFSTTETSEDQFRVPVAVNAHNLSVSVATAPGVGNDPWVITLRDDAASTTLTCTISGASTTCTDVTNNPAIAAASLLNILVISSGANPDPTATAEMTISFCVAP